MTLKELKTRNPDIILDEIQWDDLPAMAHGATVFYASLAGGNKPKDDRTVLHAGYAMTAGFTAANEIVLVRLTTHWNPKLDPVPEDAVRPGGRAALFATRPVTAGDPRSSEMWDKW